MIRNSRKSSQLWNSNAQRKGAQVLYPPPPQPHMNALSESFHHIVSSIREPKMPVVGGTRREEIKALIISSNSNKNREV
ncbi:MAG: hypothetical protein LBC27_06030 [Spirochaetaceae bacterium]|nr:hypothetical protein [Spirochaetaceae bacterium]